MWAKIQFNFRGISLKEKHIGVYSSFILFVIDVHLLRKHQWVL